MINEDSGGIVGGLATSGCPPAVSEQPASEMANSDRIRTIHIETLKPLNFIATAPFLI
jgi:hypothetical protein